MKCSYCRKELVRNLTMLEILWPFLVRNEELCSECRRTFTEITEPHCPTCMKKEWTEMCDDCRQWQMLYPDYPFTHQAIFQYNDAFSDWLSRYKFLGDYRLCMTFNQEVKKALRPYHEYLICPIPLSEERLVERGFNQTAAFLTAAGIEQSLLLKRKLDLAPQSQKNRRERMEMVQPYQLNVPATTIYNKKILIVDDVYTTGRTLFHAASILLEHQPAEVRTFSLAR